MRRFGKAMAALAVAACTLLGGVATANAADVTNKDNPITLSNVRVSDVGAQTANVSFDYRIDLRRWTRSRTCASVSRCSVITDITPIEKAHSSANTIGGAGFTYIMDCSTGVSDDELTAGSYDSIYGFHGDKEYKGVFLTTMTYRLMGARWLSRPLANGSPGGTRTPGMARPPAVLISH